MVSRFDERFGAGTEWPIGDEYIFLADLLRRKLSGMHVALPLAKHPRLSSGMAFDAKSLETRRAVFRRAVGRLWFRSSSPSRLKMETVPVVPSGPALRQVRGLVKPSTGGRVRRAERNYPSTLAASLLSRGG